jgi:hypothetical protein
MVIPGSFAPEAAMNDIDRNPFLLLALSALKTPEPCQLPLACPPPLAEAEALTEDEEDALMERLRDALHQRGYDVT